MDKKYICSLIEAEKDKRVNRIPALFSIQFLTRRLMETELTDDIDVFELWSYRGRTLRSLHNRKYRKC